MYVFLVIKTTIQIIKNLSTLKIYNEEINKQLGISRKLIKNIIKNNLL